jgi:hypothetical protein
MPARAARQVVQNDSVAKPRRKPVTSSRACSAKSALAPRSTVCATGKQYGLDRSAELQKVDRLFEVGLEADGQGSIAAQQPRVAGDRDDGDVPKPGIVPDRADQVVSALARHGDIANDDVGDDAMHRGERRPHRIDRRDEGARVAQDRVENVAGVVVVVHDQDASPGQVAVGQRSSAHGLPRGKRRAGRPGV